MPKVSVIIPVYGVEKYIERCARSLFEQTLDDIEYIFVDDCSPDKSIAILENIIKEYLGAKLIEIQIDKTSYTLILNVKLEVGDKRRLGRLISQNTDLKKYVRKISYNNSQDTSGQLFVLKKVIKNETLK